jgi:type II secretory ATPase GspE/PulE/Tfp pilus assembly ATPase PilB-like protein
LLAAVLTSRALPADPAEDGIAKVLAGITSVDELLRVTHAG